MVFFESTQYIPGTLLDVRDCGFSGVYTIFQVPWAAILPLILVTTLLAGHSSPIPYFADKGAEPQKEDVIRSMSHRCYVSEQGEDR